jgi:hypothetical protein
MGRNPTQQGRPQENSGKHFSYHPRLMELAKQAARQAADGQYDRDLQDQVE